MDYFKNILVSVDTRSESHPALDWAVRWAEHCGAKLTIVDVLPDFSWAVRITMSNHGDVQKTLMAEKQHRLETLAESVASKGLPVETLALSGQSSVEIVRAVLRDGYDLVVRVNKGFNSRRAGPIGNTSFGLLRKCPCPVWLVHPAAPPRFQKILAAVDPDQHDDAHESLNSEILELARLISQYEKVAFGVIYSWMIVGEHLLESRMSDEEFEELKSNTRDTVAQRLNKVLSQHGLSAQDDNVHLVKGEPAATIPSFAKEHKVDLVVMGTVGRSGMSGLLMGNTAELILNRLECGILALKPPEFVSPVKA